jgi:hypothetical protein
MRSKRLPDLDLERRAVEHEVEPIAASRLEDRAAEMRHAHLVGDEACQRPARLHVGERRRAPAVELEGKAADAARRREDQRIAERRVRPAIGDLEPLPAALELAGRDRFVGNEEIVQPARRRQAARVGRVEHAGGLGSGTPWHASSVRN